MNLDNPFMPRKFLDTCGTKQFKKICHFYINAVYQSRVIKWDLTLYGEGEPATEIQIKLATQ